MSEAKFTKGEWKISSDGLSVGVDGFKVARAFSGSATPYVMQTTNNAHLIASAPEMYKALIRVQQEGGLSVARHKSISKLLAKARGES